MSEPVMVPQCGYSKMKSASHKPWNEREVKITNKHIIKHVSLDFLYTVRTNYRVIILFFVFVLTIGVAVFFHFITPLSAVYVAMFLIALIIGLLVRTAKKDIIIEGLQVWLKEAYGVYIPYTEAAIAYANFTNHRSEYNIPNAGTLVRVPAGLVLQPTETG